MSLNYFDFTIKICNSTNKLTNVFIFVLHKQIQIVKIKDHKITYKRIVRIYAFLTKHIIVIKENNLNLST